MQSSQQCSDRKGGSLGPSPQITADWESVLNGTSRYIKGWRHGRGADSEVGPGSYGSCLQGVLRGISG